LKISVYITSYNQKEHLKEAIESVLNQTLKPYEILIVDDFSSDGSQDLIKAYSNKYPELVRYIFHSINRGVTEVRIKALKNLTGDYVTYVDGDDLYLPTKLEKEYKLLESGNYDIAFSNNYYVESTNEEIIKWIWAYNIKDLPEPGDMFLHTLTRKFPRNSLFRMELVNKKAWDKIGFHDPKLKIYEDYDMRIRLAKHLRINYTIEPLTKIRISKSGLSKSPNERFLKSLKYIYDKYQEEINLLPKKEQEFIRMRFQELFKKFDRNHSSGISFKDKIKHGLI